MDWQNFSEDNPKWGGYIVVKASWGFRGGYFQGFCDTPLNSGEDIIGVKDGMPLFHKGKFIHFFTGIKNESTLAHTPDMQWIEITKD